MLTGKGDESIRLGSFDDKENYPFQKERKNERKGRNNERKGRKNERKRTRKRKRKRKRKEEDEEDWKLYLQEHMTDIAGTATRWVMEDPLVPVFLAGGAHHGRHHNRSVVWDTAVSRWAGTE